MKLTSMEQHGQFTCLGNLISTDYCRVIKSFRNMKTSAECHASDLESKQPSFSAPPP